MQHASRSPGGERLSPGNDAAFAPWSRARASCAGPCPGRGSTWNCGSAAGRRRSGHVAPSYRGRLADGPGGDVRSSGGTSSSNPASASLQLPATWSKTLGALRDPVPGVGGDVVMVTDRRDAVFDLLDEVPREHGADPIVTPLEELALVVKDHLDWRRQIPHRRGHPIDARRPDAPVRPLHRRRSVPAAAAPAARRRPPHLENPPLGGRGFSLLHKPYPRRPSWFGGGSSGAPFPRCYLLPLSFDLFVSARDDLPSGLGGRPVGLRDGRAGALRRGRRRLQSLPLLPCGQRERR